MLSVIYKTVYSLVGSERYATLLDTYHAIERRTRIASSRLRALPDFLIVGTQKGGTTSLYRYLASHPQVVSVSPWHPDAETTWSKEIHYFDDHYDKPESWYRFHFPLKLVLARKKFITGEGSPDYLYHPHAPKRIASTIPQVKLIACLRDPVDRAISHYWHQVRAGIESLPMKDAFDYEEDRIRKDAIKIANDETYNGYNFKQFSYVRRGIYAEQIDRYYSYFDKSNMLVIRSEDLFENAKDVYDRVVSFLGLRPYNHVTTKTHNAGTYVETDPQLRRELREYFEPHNERLYNLLGVAEPWW